MLVYICNTMKIFSVLLSHGGLFLWNVWYLVMTFSIAFSIRFISLSELHLISLWWVLLFVAFLWFAQRAPRWTIIIFAKHTLVPTCQVIRMIKHNHRRTHWIKNLFYLNLLPLILRHLQFLSLSRCYWLLTMIGLIMDKMRGDSGQSYRHKHGMKDQKVTSKFDVSGYPYHVRCRYSYYVHWWHVKITSYRILWNVLISQWPRYFLLDVAANCVIKIKVRKTKPQTTRSSVQRKRIEYFYAIIQVS